MWKFAALLAFSLTLAAQGTPGWNILLSSSAKLQPNVDVPMEVTITDAKGQPVTASSVEMIVTMVDMDHGESKSSAKMWKPGAYRGAARFHMAGTWNVKVHAVSGRETADKDFRFDVQD